MMQSPKPENGKRRPKEVTESPRNGRGKRRRRQEGDGTTTSNATKDDDKVKIAIETQCLLKLEGKLLPHFLQSTTGHRMTFAEFRTLVSKLTLPDPKPSTSTSTSTSTQQHLTSQVAVPPELAARDCRMWHDLICVSDGILYRFAETVHHAIAELRAGVAGRTNTNQQQQPQQQQDGENGTMYLTLHPFQGNRRKEMRRLGKEAEENGVSAQTSRRVRQSLREMRGIEASKRTSNLRAQKEAATTAAVGKQSREPNPPADSMAIETEDSARDVHRSGSLKECLRVADALHKHIHGILKGRNAAAQVASNRLNQESIAESPACVLIFSDITKLFPNDTATALSSHLRNIYSLVPVWLQIMDPPSMNVGSAPSSALHSTHLSQRQSTIKPIDHKPLSQDATIWVAAVGFEAACLKMGGKPDGQHQVQTQSTSNPKRPDQNKVSARPLAQKKKIKSGNGKKVTRILVPTNSSRSNQEQQQQQQPPKKQRRRQLRINPDFILCDADHSGGTVIHPTFNSPRSLKRLMDKMNVGERI